ncbi:MAG TPA: hypothetical protein DD490_11090 [Acidobacteria bacterium]|nr:hypothetical protein [Acidobacteriota bacterium]
MQGRAFGPFFLNAGETPALPGGVLGKLGGVRGGGAGGVPGQDLGYDTSMARSVEHLWIELVEQVERLWEANQ